MNIFKLSFRNITGQPLNTTLSLVLLTLGVGMISLLIQVDKHIEEQMENNVRGIDMVVGAKGSPLQLILSAVYHIDAPTGNIPLKEAQQLQKNRLVEYGIPLSYGDSYQGYRIVGTNTKYLDLYEAKIKHGRIWETPFEVVLGATVAQQKHLSIGDTFYGSHGLTAGGEEHHEHAYRVTGILDYSNSVIDQLILTATESVWAIHHHHHDGEHEEEHAAEEEGEHHKEITAMLVKFRNPVGLIQVPRMVNEKTNMQAAIPAYEISRLFGLLGVGIDTLGMIAIVIMVVSGLSIFISLYNAMKEREYEMALMRTYGATRIKLVILVLQEGLLLTITGFLLGISFSRIGLWLISGLMESSYHYAFSGWVWLNEEWLLLIAAIAIGLLASIMPAIRVFHVHISKTLSDA